MRTNLSKNSPERVVRRLATACLLLACFALIYSALNLRSWAYYGGLRVWPTSLVLSGCLGLLGLGTYFCRKWAVITLAICTSVLGLVLSLGAVATLLKGAYPTVLINVPVGLVLFLPLRIAITHWKQLR